MKTGRHLSITPLLALWALLCSLSSSAEAQTPPTLKTETFDRDPGWEDHNNRVVPKVVKAVRQRSPSPRHQISN